MSMAEVQRELREASEQEIAEAESQIVAAATPPPAPVKMMSWQEYLEQCKSEPEKPRPRTVAEIQARNAEYLKQKGK